VPDDDDDVSDNEVGSLSFTQLRSHPDEEEAEEAEEGSDYNDASEFGEELVSIVVFLPRLIC
jgi:hypothetical protein